MFKKILIANRGEIACRVIRTARKMGIRTVAVYSDADRNAMHVEMADEAVHIGPPPSKDSYLQAGRIIEACKSTGAEAVHPGYGFLSENGEFSRTLEEQGIVFIGPKHYSVAAMGDKIASKKLAIEAGVRVIPGVNDAIGTPERAIEIARGIGFPVMIKASAGGGGKGLRIARNDAEVREGFQSCKNEAKASFGDDRVFIEKFVEEPRHIEIQVIGDAHGNIVYLGERDCSVQRRHQKVIEEAPSPFIDAKVRKAMGEQAVALAKAVRYESAGTVEFVVGKDRSFYFLEMNTRLQVEHPVTEMTTGLDLVELMIRVAAGEKLPLRQQDVKITGWAIEARICAEDPARNFLPSSGRLVRFLPPEQEAGTLRVDTGVYEGGEVSMYYDSMIAKLIAHGGTRDEAIGRLREALNAFVIRGPSHNVSFVSEVLRHPRFVSGKFTTAFIGEEYPNGFNAAAAAPEDPVALVAVAGAIHRLILTRTSGIVGQLPGHEFRIRRDFVVLLYGKEYPIEVTEDAGAYRVVHDGETLELVIDWRCVRKGVVRGTINGRAFAMQAERSGLHYRLTHWGRQVDAHVVSPRAAELIRLMPKKAPPDLSKFVLSPMPGLLTAVEVSAGQEVKAGDRLAVIEAMKMENVLKAERDGAVAEVMAKAGETLAVDQPVLRMK